MQCLTDNEVSQWLRERKIPEAPYHQGSSPGYHLQFHVPKSHRAKDTFIRNYFSLLICNSETLVHITDWGLYTESEMIPVLGIRALHSESRNLIDAPGHSLESDETEAGIALMTLTASFAWSSYLYCPRNHATLYNWEGDILDFWTDNFAQISIMKTLLSDFELNETSNAESANDPR